MSPPIYTPDGSEVSEIVLPDGSTASEVIDPDGNVVFEAGPDIPDSVVSRPEDTRSASGRTQQNGIIIETHTEWPDIGARLSSMGSGMTRAYLYRMSDAQLLSDVDISNLTNGDIVTFGLNSPLSANTEFALTVDAEGSEFTIGYNALEPDGTFSPPYSSADVSIVDGASDGAVRTDNSHAFVEVGNLGFD